MIAIKNKTYRSLIELTHAIYFEMELKPKKFTYVSSQIEKILGFPQNLWIDLDSWANCIHPEDREKIVNYCMELTELGLDHEFEYRAINSTNTIVWISEKVTVVKKKNKPIQLVGFMIDITEQKKLEQLFYQSNDKLSSILDSIDDLIFTLDKNNVFTGYYQSKQEKNLYVPPEQFIGKTYQEVLPPYLVQLIDKALCNLKTKDEIQQFDYSINIAGQERWFNAKLTKRTNKAEELDGITIVTRELTDKKEFAGVTVVTREITERKEIEKALQESEKRFRTMFEQASIAVSLYNSATGHFIKVNQKFCDFLGYSEKELLEKSFKEITYPDDLAATLENVEKLKKGLIHNFTMQKRYYHKNGSVVWGNLSVSSLLYESEESIYHLAIIQDITKQKEMELELEQKINELEKFNKMAVGRELRMIELKKEVNELLISLGRETRYKAE